jgi:signal peptidase II
MRLACTLFFAIAAAIVVTDQLAKQWILSGFVKGEIHPVLGDWLQINFVHNGGALFGVLQGTAALFAVVTIAVMAVIVGTEVRWGWRAWASTVALGLLLGGAVGNLIDRVRLGYVVDFVDIGIGSWRFWVFNVADMAVTTFFILIIGLWLIFPRLLPADDRASSAKGEGPVAK